MILILIPSNKEYSIMQYRDEKKIHQTNAQLAGSGSPSCKQPSGTQNQTSSRSRQSGDHVLCRTSERGCHRVDLKDVACVNMQDSS
ncbi:hypothetical protein PAXRUDRAFT_822618 [Paxillus rubicundulus Ve08.2h10]|uniref:Uncharacterized protein n=1 Tax=Paxillus rubicundulus Ve08.2h10 TaxID=930991 RepID=A0A0D0DW97_9AGAM|nr:hypothetical protein PAXRUDRAFT_822618 [Paxillus rubicundulus Ve08.2h10]